MRDTLRRAVAVAAAALTLLGFTTIAAAEPVGDAVSTFSFSQNMHPTGYSARVVPLDNTVAGAGVFNSDLAFWGKTAYQGTYEGFRIVDITEPDNPVQVLNYTQCSPGTGLGNQGDIIVWGDILVRSWNSNTTNPAATCDGEPVALGFEGLHVFDISNPADPDLVASVDLPQGSHTATGVPDLASGRLLVYNSASSSLNPGIDIVQIPLSAPQNAALLHTEPSGRSCHDTGVILGDVLMAACAGGNGFTVWSMDPDDGGSLTDPAQLYSRVVEGVTIGHSASFTWDGEILIFGHEPGGGGQAQCQATSSVTNRSLFFFDAENGDLLGQAVHARPQTALENCTWHNYNVVATDKRYLLVSGNYQSGISVLDFTNPAAATEVAFADPATLVDPTPPVGIELGGDWSTYWYDGRIYESDITRGLIVWNPSDNALAGAMKLGHLNPQTQETSFEFKGTAFGKTKQADQQGIVVFGESAPGQNTGGEGGRENYPPDGTP
ncbi:MAG: hypothetical protein L0206_19120 [Actinobacteria bacterium]|nr:hypothetical protein [Actinomycetota bacterium]